MYIKFITNKILRVFNYGVNIKLENVNLISKTTNRSLYTKTQLRSVYIFIVVFYS